MYRTTYLNDGSLIEVLEVIREDQTNDLYLITPKLKNFIQQAKHTDQELIDFAISNAEFAVESKFTSDSINQINRLYYSQPQFAFDNSVGLAKVYNECTPLIRAIAKLFTKERTEGTAINIVELSVGAKLNAWLDIANQLPQFDFKLLATDLVDPRQRFTTAAVPTNLDIETKILNMLNETEIDSLPNDQDVIFTSYGFDSLWYPEDLNIVKGDDGKWYKTLTRVKVGRESKGQIDMIEALKRGSAEFDLSISNFRAAFIEEARFPLDIENFKYGEVIKEKYGSHDGVVEFNFPGGLIDRVKRLSHHLAPGGIFVSGDVAAHSVGQDIAMRTNEKSGLIARYSVEDYDLASTILRNEGFDVTILTFEEISNNLLDKGWEQNESLEHVKLLRDNKNNCLLVVGRG